MRDHEHEYGVIGATIYCIDRDCGAEWDLPTVMAEHLARHPSQPTGSASGTCPTWCGQTWDEHQPEDHPRGGVFHKYDPDRCFCTAACRDAGHPLNPHPETPAGTGTQRELSECPRACLSCDGAGPSGTCPCVGCHTPVETHRGRKGRVL